MKQEVFFSHHDNCKKCQERAKSGFLLMESKKGDKKTFEVVDAFTLVFIMKGEALVSCNEFTDVQFNAGEAFLLPVNSDCTWEALTDTECLVLVGSGDLTICDKEGLSRYGHKWLNIIPDFKPLVVKQRLEEFLVSVKNYITDGIVCPHIHKAKERELSILLRAYYSPMELFEFFVPTVRNTQAFEAFIMNNYMKMKGVKEFVDSSGMNLSTFNRKFKAHFKETPYQWLMKQRAKHIRYALTSTDKTLAEIANEFYFSDASHFNRYCKSMFGDSPTRIRAQAENNRKTYRPYADSSSLPHFEGNYI